MLINASSFMTASNACHVTVTDGSDNVQNVKVACETSSPNFLIKINSKILIGWKFIVEAQGTTNTNLPTVTITTLYD